MKFIKNRLQAIKDDSYLFLTLLITFICIFLHAYQYYDSQRYEPLVRMGICTVSIFVIFFAGRNGSYVMYFIYANFLALTMDFQNYTAFFIIIILTILVPRFKIHLIIIYAIDVIVVATMHNKTPVHVVIHTLNCVLFYFSLHYLLRPAKKTKDLHLTNDERLILEELSKGKTQKEIKQFSQNTVCNKLKSARLRNNIATNDEIIMRFVEQKNNQVDRNLDDILSG